MCLLFMFYIINIYLVNLAYFKNPRLLLPSFMCFSFHLFFLSPLHSSFHEHVWRHCVLGLRLNSGDTVVHKAELCCLSLGSSQFIGIKQYSAVAQIAKQWHRHSALFWATRQSALPTTTRILCPLIHLSFMSISSWSSQTSLLAL